MPKTALVLLIFLALPVNAADYIRLLSTTSTENSGLLNHLLPIFEKSTGIKTYVVALGTGQAIRAAKNGDGDLLMVHDRASEIAFMQAGYGIRRREFMYNDFLLVGPAQDPAAIAGSSGMEQALFKLAQSDAVFVSRGDDSGTHKRELSLWRKAGIDPQTQSGWKYREVGAGMGKTLNIAATIDGYTLVDRGTWLSFKNRQKLKILYQGDAQLFNQYSVIEIDPTKHPHIKVKKARRLADWLVSEEGQAEIANFKINGKQLFIPNYAERTRGRSQ